jgi:DNA-binding CsgD family transcriptional regulator
MTDMSRSEIGDSQLLDRVERNTDEPDIVRLSAARARAVDEAGAAIARQLNGPLTALLLYMGEIKQHSHQFSQASADRDYLQKVVDNALQQTERVCALVKQIAGPHQGIVAAAIRRTATQDGAGRPTKTHHASGVMLASDAGQRPLTKREREVLNLISQGYSNKQGALRMRISPRTFESHRAEAMRKLGARNTADLVRAALLHPID